MVAIPYFSICTILHVPFVLVEGGWLPSSDYAIVNLDGSEHPLPLTTVYHRLQPINVSPHTFLQAIFGHECPVSLEIAIFKFDSNFE